MKNLQQIQIPIKCVNVCRILSKYLLFQKPPCLKDDMYWILSEHLLDTPTDCRLITLPVEIV